MKIETTITDLKIELEQLYSTYNIKRSQLIEKTQKLVKHAAYFDNNWVGQWASPNYNVYRDFSRDGSHVSLEKKYIQNYIEKKSDLVIKEIGAQIENIVKPYKDFQEKIITELSVIKGQENFLAEAELLNKLESEEWGMTARAYIELKQPRTFITHDPDIHLNRGLEIPPHLRVDGDVFSLFSTIRSTENFEKSAKRILRQLEIKYSIEETSTPKSDVIFKIINSFHSVALQLKNRYNNRETLSINDEYDVQDLLHSLLRIEFSDIRSEEYTPSYAGSSTRVDFLLKKEKIVIEVKKTRKGLADKKIGEQLILDSQHYKVHPDCNQLICFVYDPENKVKNPRGLESDLNNLSTDDLTVYTFIRP